MKLGLTSDWHGEKFPDAPDVDLIIHAGDLLPDDDKDFFYIKRFDRWMEQHGIPTIVVAGNHDTFLETPIGKQRIRETRAIYLEDETIEYEGLVIHGSPYTPTFRTWAFMKDDEHLTPHWENIPDLTDILITHGPPWSILDKNDDGVLSGSKTLYRELRRLENNLKCHVYGHIHENRGSIDIYHNVSYLDECYKPRDEAFVIVNI